MFHSCIYNLFHRVMVECNIPLTQFVSILIWTMFSIWFVDWNLLQFNVLRNIRFIKKFLVVYFIIQDSPEKGFNNVIKCLEFVTKHANEFCSHTIIFNYPSFSKIDYSLLSRLFIQFKRIAMIHKNPLELPVFRLQEVWFSIE